MLVIAIILWGLLSLIMLLLVILISPVRLDVRAVAEPEPFAVVRARLFGGLAPSLRIIDSRRKKMQKHKDKAAKKSVTLKKPSGWKKSPAMAQDIMTLIADILRKIHIDHLSLNVEFGFDNPADTGHAFGMMTPLVYGGALAGSTVLLHPNFERRCFSGELDSSLRFIPVSLVMPIIGFIWTNFGPMR